MPLIRVVQVVVVEGVEEGEAWRIATHSCLYRTLVVAKVVISTTVVVTKTSSMDRDQTFIVIAGEEEGDLHLHHLAAI